MLPISTCDSPLFREYGTLLGRSAPDIAEYLSDRTPMPEKNNLYVRDDERMHELPSYARIREEVFGGGPVEIGYCNGYNTRLNCLEYHACPEVDVPSCDLVLLLARPEDVKDGKVDSSAVRAFLAHRGEAVLLKPYTLHFSPCRQSRDGFRCAILLSDGTNRDLPAGFLPKDPKLWKENKWLLAHPDSAQAGAGAYVGITGENIEIPC